MFSHAFSSELDHCCCVWHLVLLIPILKLENDFLCNHASNWAVLFFKWFVFENGDSLLNSPYWDFFLWILFIKFGSCFNFSWFFYIYFFHGFYFFSLHSGSWVSMQWLPFFFMEYRLQYGPQYCSGYSMINAKHLWLIFIC